VGELVWQQVGIGQLMGVVGVAFFFNAIVRRLTMLQAVLSAAVRER
jgi:hypothetical protein